LAEAGSLLGNGVHGTKRVKELVKDIKFFGQLHANNQFFWEGLAPCVCHNEKDSSFTLGGGKMCKEHGLDKAINQKWGSYEKFMEEFKESTKKNEPHGWTWLAYNYEKEELEI